MGQGEENNFKKMRDRGRREGETGRKGKGRKRTKDELQGSVIYHLEE